MIEKELFDVAVQETIDKISAIQVANETPTSGLAKIADFLRENVRETDPGGNVTVVYTGAQFQGQYT